MNGYDIARARRAAGVSQGRLAEALNLKGGRGTLTDIENGLIEVTDAFVLRTISVINGLSDRSGYVAENGAAA